MTRIERLNSLKSHPALAKDFKRLTRAELIEVEDFVRKTESLNDGDFMLSANRFKLDQPKTKGFTIQWSLLIQCVDTVSNLRKKRR